MIKKTVAIVIPVYKDVPSEDEVVSFKQCLAILGKFPIIIIHPKGLDLKSYEALLSGNWNVSFKGYEPEYFKNLKGYNRLLTSGWFYRDFLEYRFILIYQLDSFVFRDELLAWCDLGYDYIGAPWINIDLSDWLAIRGWYPREVRSVHKLTRGKFMRRVGNGGVSLRKVSSFIFNLSVFSYRVNNMKANEDIFFSHYVGTLNPFFTTPSVKTALKFSIDSKAEEAFTLNQCKLPFCCHGWSKVDGPLYKGNHEFWMPHIKAHMVK